MTISILTTDANLIIRSWDTRLATMTGMSAQQVCGQKITAIIPDLEERGIIESFERVIQKGVREILNPQQHNYLISVPTPEPSKYFSQMQQQVTIAPLKEGEKIIGTIVTIEDVTAKLERDLDIRTTLKPPSAKAKTMGAVDPVQLKTALASESWQVRHLAVEQLSMRTDPQLTEELVQLLRQHHRNPSILNSVLSALSEVSVDPLPALQSCLQDQDKDIRIYAALALGERNDKRAIPMLLGALNDPDINVQVTAIEALGRLNATQAVEPLIKIAQSEDFYLAFAALDALLSIGAVTPRVLPLLQQTLDWQVRREAVDTLTMQDDSRLMGELVQLLRKHHQNPNILNSVIQILTLSHLDPVPLLLQCLQESDPDLRIYTALTLGERQDQRAIPALIKAVKDPEPNVCYHAIEALGKLHAAQAIEVLIEIAHTQDFFLSFPAVESLLSIGDYNAGAGSSIIAPQLVPLLNSELLCPLVLETLGKLGDGFVVPPMAALLNQENAPIAEIALAIHNIYQRYERSFEGGHIKDLVRSQVKDQGILSLIEAAKSANNHQLCALVFILGCLEGRLVEEALSHLLKQSAVRESVVEALVSHGSRVTDLLIAQLESFDLPTRKSAVVALGRIGSNASVPHLINLLYTEPELTTNITQALAQIGDHSAFEALLSLLAHPDGAVRLGAIAALNSLGHPAMPSRIFLLLDSEDVNVRESAVKIAGYFAYEQCVDKILHLSRTDKEEKVRRCAIESLPYLEDPRVLNILVEALNQDTAGVRACAAHALGVLEDVDTLPHLLAALKDENSWVRYQAARSLERCQDLLHQKDQEETANYINQAFCALQEIIDLDPQIPTRAAAVEAIAALAKEKAIPLLSALIETSPENEIARAAIMGLGQIQQASAVGPLLNALNSPHEIRRYAIIAFRSRGGTEAEVALQWMAAADPEPTIALEALESLARMATPEAIQALLELTIDPNTHQQVINTLSQRRKSPKTTNLEYIEAIAQGLNHPQIPVRCAVVEILKELKHPYASAHLIEALNDQESSVRLCAVNALIYLGNRSCQEQLRILARSDPNPGVRRAAQKMLSQSSRGGEGN